MILNVFRIFSVQCWKIRAQRTISSFFYRRSYKTLCESLLYLTNVSKICDIQKNLRFYGRIFQKFPIVKESKKKNILQKIYFFDFIEKILKNITFQKIFDFIEKYSKIWAFVEIFEKFVFYRNFLKISDFIEHF